MSIRSDSSVSRRQFISMVGTGTVCSALALVRCDTLSSMATKTVDTLHIGFVPSKAPDDIIAAVEPLKQMLMDELSSQGYAVGTMDITVGTSYDAVGEALSSGTIDVGFIPGGTYVLHSDGCEVLLMALRDGLSIDSDSAKDWNDQKPTQDISERATTYRALLIAGPSDKGIALGAKVNNGEELIWDDLASASWSVMEPSSSAGYIHPSLWLKDTYGKTIPDLPYVTQADSFDSSFARLAEGQVDVLCVYADGRRDYESKWQSDYGRSASIWDETNVIGVTQAIHNDTVSCSKSSPTMTADFKEAFSTAMVSIGDTDEGKQAIAIYGHKGYIEAQDSDYDEEREACSACR